MKKRQLRAVGKKPQAQTTADTGKASYSLKGMRNKTAHLSISVIDCLYFVVLCCNYAIKFDTTSGKGIEEI